MLKDITLGQYFPGDTVAHRLDPRTKLLLVIIYIVGLFNAVGWASYAFVILITALSMAISKIKPKSALKGLKPLVIIIILTAVLNIFYTGGTPIIEGWIITWEGIARAVMMSLRIILLIVGTFMLTYTTSPIALTDGLEIMLNPLKKIKIPVHEMSMMMSMALRFIPKMFVPLEADESRKGEIITETVSVDAEDSYEVLDVTQKISDHEPIDKASLLVCGGRGIKSEEDLKMLGELAELLGGQVAASRPIVDNGWLPHEEQIGQSGATVKPDHIINIAISGSVQYQVGMQNSKCIISINHTAGVPIFDISHYGAVADYRSLVPAIIEEIKKRK